MTQPQRSGSSKRRSVLRLGVVGIAVVVSVFVLLLVLARPSTLAWILGGALVGVLLGVTVRLLISHRAESPLPAPEAEAPASLRVGSRGGCLGGVALIAVVAIVAVFVSTGRDASNIAPPSPTPAPPETIQRAGYSAELAYVDPGEWTGTETFTLSSGEAEGLLPPSAGTLQARLEAAVPGWTVHPEIQGMATTFKVSRPYPAIRFDAPDIWPLTVFVAIPAPELRSDKLRRPVQATAGSTVALVAPTDRVHGTDPSSSVKPARGGQRRTVKLEAKGPQDAGSGVAVQVRSDKAMFLPAAAVDLSVASATQKALGLITTSVVFVWITGIWGWLWKRLRRNKTEPSPHILRGHRSKQAALTAHFEALGLDDADRDAAINNTVAQLGIIAVELIESGGGDALKAKYFTARRQAKGPPADAIYRAMRKVGLSSETGVLDDRADQWIAANY